MAINLINPNFNLIGAVRTSGALEGSAPGAVQSFSDILESVISNGVQRNLSSNGDAVSVPSGSGVDLDEIFRKASDTYHVPVELLKAVAKAESNFDPAAESHAGAQGIMQLMPGTARSLGVTDAFDPEQNIMGGAKYLSQQLERYGGNTVLALAAYNAGPGNVAKYNGVPPFKETQNYIAKVMGYAGEPITAGDASLPARVSPADDDGLRDLSLGLLGLSSDDLGFEMKDYALLMELYRYKMQLNILSDSEPASGTDSIPSSFAGLV